VCTLESPAQKYVSRYNDSHKYIYGINPIKSYGITCPQKLESLGIRDDMMLTYFIHRKKIITTSSWKPKKRTILHKNTD